MLMKAVKECCPAAGRGFAGRMYTEAEESDTPPESKLRESGDVYSVYQARSQLSTTW